MQFVKLNLTISCLVLYCLSNITFEIRITILVVIVISGNAILQYKQGTVQWVQNPSQRDVDNLNCVRCEV
jgi:hypothetical protein